MSRNTLTAYNRLALIFILAISALSLNYHYGLKAAAEKVNRYKICNEKLTLECLQKAHTIENMEINRIFAGRAQYPIALPWGKLYKDTPEIAQTRKDIRERAKGANNGK